VTVPVLTHSHPKSAMHAGGEIIHEVKSGDTLSAIAKHYGVRVGALIAANGLERPDALRPGQQLVIPSGSRGGASVGDRGRAMVAPRHFVLRVPDVDGRAPAFRWPVEGPVSSEFGRRRNGWHAGIDIRAEMGTPILAAADGTVIFSGWERLYGRVVKITHAGGFVTVYAHNLQNLVRSGNTVDAGQVIGMVGRTGRASTYHLHFEIRNDGRVFNPVFLLPVPDLHVAPDAEPEPEQDDAGDG
jgi:murein DD-endopeptidase MepM/ murein hydrolase activator NlpD